jgi:hypothetical protein
LWPEGEPVAVWGEAGTPDGFEWAGRAHRLLEVCNRWRVHTRWWEPEEAVWREYLKVTTDTGLLCLIYRDLLSEPVPSSSRENWFLARLYD